MALERASTPRIANVAWGRDGTALTVLGLFLLTFAIFCLSASGRGFSGDGAQVYYTAKHLVTRGTIELDEYGSRIGAIQGRDGHYFSKYPPAMSVVEAPFYAPLHRLGAYVGLEGKPKAKMVRAWVPTLANAIIVSLILVVFYLVVRTLGYHQHTGLVGALLLAFTTPLWPYSGYDFSEPLQALLLLTALWPLARKDPSLASVFASALALAGLLLTKALFILVVPVFLVAWIVKLNRRRLVELLRIAIVFGVPLLLAVLILFYWNWLRFGDSLKFGYGEPFNTPLLVGLFGWFFSPGKSVFLYSPLLILSVIFFGVFYRQNRLIAAVILGATVPLVVAYSVFWSWHGDWAWALRYAVPLLPLWFLPLASVFESGAPVYRWAVGILAALGLFVQVLGVSISASNYLSVHANQILPAIHPAKPRDLNHSGLYIHFIPEFSPLAGHWWLLTGAIERLRNPDRPHSENKALQSFPWAGRGERHSWRPDRPEEGARIDLWVVHPPPYLGAKSRYNFAMRFFLIVAVAGSLILLIGQRRYTRRS